MFKKIIGTRVPVAILSVCLFVSIILGAMLPLKIAHAAKNGVETRIDSLLSEFPDGSYFSKSRQACTHIPPKKTCDNCSLKNTIPTTRNPGAKLVEAWTCAAFARYAYYVLFGIDTYYIRNSAKQVPLSQARVGDWVVVRNGGHYAIYLSTSADKQSVYLYESNYGVPNKVSYNRATKASDISEVWRANNYDAIAGSTDTVLPQGSWITPASGTAFTPSGTMALSVNASDNVSVKNVTFHAYYDGSWHDLGTDTHGGNGTYTFNWSYSIKPQDVLIHAHVYDTTGNMTNIYGPTVKIANKPGVPTLNVPATDFTTEAVKFTWGATTDTTHYDLRILQNGTIIKTIFTIKGTNYSLSLPAGNYTAFLCSVNGNYHEWWTQGNTVAFEVVMPPSKPPTPTGLKATPVSYDSIKLTWSAAAGANGYGIYRSTNTAGPYTLIANATTNSFINNNLATGTAYYYKISAYKIVKASKYYGNQTAAVSAKTALGSPSGLKAVSASYNSIKLTWAATPGASGYAVYRASAPSGKYAHITDSASTSCTNADLATGKTYYYKIKAYHLEGTARVYGDFSAYASAKPVMNAPASPKAVSASYNSIKLAWGAVPGASGYTVYRAASANGNYSTAGSSKSTAYTFTGLVTGKTCYFKVRAYRTQGSSKVYGGYSSYASAAAIPCKPTTISAQKASPSSIKVSWSAVSGATKYLIYRSASSTGTYSNIGVAAATSYTDSGLIAGSVYYYKVRAYHQEGSVKVYGDYSGIAYTKLVPQVSVPNVAGMTWSNAKAKLLEVGLTAVKNEIWHNTVPAETVISQNTAAGTLVYQGSSVTLTVSKGPQTANVPNLFGMSKENAQAALAAAGLAAGSINQPYRWEYAYNSVFEQSIASGTAVARGTAVNFSVSNGAKPIAVGDWVYFDGGRLYVASTGTSGNDKASSDVISLLQITDLLTNGRYGVRFVTTGGRYGWANQNLIHQCTN